MIIDFAVDEPPQELERKFMLALGLYPDDRVFTPVPVGVQQER